MRIIGLVLMWGSIVFGQLPGDFDTNGVYNCFDIDAINRQVATGGSNLEFDLDADGHVTRSDIDEWLLIAGTANIGVSYVYGDADLDGNIQNSDFSGVWNANKFWPSNRWCDGDHNADGVVDWYDGLLMLSNSNYFPQHTSEGVGYGPEPRPSDVARFIYDPQTGHMYGSMREKLAGWVIPGPEPEQMLTLDEGFDPVHNLVWSHVYFNGSQQSYGHQAAGGSGIDGNHRFSLYPVGLTESDFGIATYGSYRTTVDLEGILSSPVEFMEVLPGDANLDGFVDVSDFNAWNEHKFTDLDANWGQGDFNGDGAVDVSDFNLWNENKFRASGSFSVPEPSAIVLMLFVIGQLPHWKRC